MIEIRNLCFSYGNNRIFEGFGSEFKQGKLYTVVGPNGSGKTTLLKLISRQIKQSSGDILIDRINSKEMSRMDLAKKVAILPQEQSRISITVYDRIMCGRYPYQGAFGKIVKEDIDAVNNSASVVGVTEFLDKDIRYLSGGERQRVYLASVLAQDTPYILFDEPTTFLDISNQFEIMTLLHRISGKGKGIIAVLHDISLAMRFSDEILFMDKKNNSFELLTPECAFESGVLQRVFNVKCSKIVLNGKTEYVLTGK